MAIELLCRTIEPTYRHPLLLVVHPVPTNEALKTESRRYNRFSRYGGNAISQACPEGFKVAAPPLDLTSDRLETCPGDHTYVFQVSQYK
jgi:hypothetical protein